MYIYMHVYACIRIWSQSENRILNTHIVVIQSCPSWCLRWIVNSRFQAPRKSSLTVIIAIWTKYVHIIPSIERVFITCLFYLVFILSMKMPALVYVNSPFHSWNFAPKPLATTVTIGKISSTNLIPRISNTPIVWFQIYPNMLFHPLPFSLFFTLLSGVKFLLPKKIMASHKKITAGGSFGYQPWRCNGMRLGKPWKNNVFYWGFIGLVGEIFTRNHWNHCFYHEM